MTLNANSEGSLLPVPAPTLSTVRLQLRPLVDDDVDNLYELHSNERVMRYWDAPAWTGPSRSTRFLANSRQLETDRSGVRVAVDIQPKTQFIGWCGLSRWNHQFRSASLTYCFTESAWGHGYGTEAVGALLRWAIDAWDLNRVQAETDTRNLASVRVLEKLGFVREGTLRQDCIVNGEISDSYIYGLLREDLRSGHIK